MRVVAIIALYILLWGNNNCNVKDNRIKLKSKDAVFFRKLNRNAMVSNRSKTCLILFKKEFQFKSDAKFWLKLTRAL